MVDRKLVDGMMFSGRDVHDRETCHLAKQVRKSYKKSLDRNIMISNQLVYADLLVPGISCGTQIGATLVIMDAFRKFVTTYMLRTKAASAVAAALKQYFAWAERQARRYTSKNIGDTRAAFPVRQLLTDKGGESRAPSSSTG